MCKLFALTDTSTISPGELSTLLQFVSADFRTTQRDGFGFSLYDRKAGGVYTERYVRPSDFVGPGRLLETLAPLSWMKEFAEVDDFSILGDWSKVTLGGPLIAHGRTSTGVVSLRNTHPFHKAGWTLAHNGVVDWHAGKLPLDTSCDSEHLLNCYVYGDGARDYAANLSGWFATLAVSPDGKLHVTKCAGTNLHFAWSSKWQAYVFTTEASLLYNINSTLQAGLTRPMPLASYVEIVFDGNKRADVHDIKPPAESKALQSKANVTLGRTPGGMTDLNDADDGGPIEDEIDYELGAQNVVDELLGWPTTSLTYIARQLQREIDGRAAAQDSIRAGAEDDDDRMQMAFDDEEARRELRRLGVHVDDGEAINMDELAATRGDDPQVREFLESYGGRL